MIDELTNLDIVDDTPLWDAWMSVVRFPALTCADELGLFDALAEEELPLERIATSLELDERSCLALLDMMTGMGLLAHDLGFWRLNGVARKCLLKGSPHYWGGLFRRLREFDVSHRTLLQALQTNRATMYNDVDFFRAHEAKRELARSFSDAMASRGAVAAHLIAGMPFLRDADLLLDVGGGAGTHAFPMLSRNPELSVIVMDLPVVCDYLAEKVQETDVADRLATFPCDFFEDRWPVECDVAFFSDILHDWTQVDCEKLVRSAVRSIRPGGKVAVSEVLLADDRSGPVIAAGYSMAMQYATEGSQFTFSELSELLGRCGLADVRIEGAAGVYTVVTGVRP